MSGLAIVEGSRLHRWSFAVLVLGLLAPGPSAGSPLRLQGSGPCSAGNGVTVVVDATAIGGELAVRCAPGSPASGFDALVAAGFSIETVATTPGLLCRVDGLPAPAEETCAHDPPADSYWAYWTVDSGGWHYATEGAAGSEPEAGSVEGWSFVDGTAIPPPPGIDPDELVAGDATEPVAPDDQPPGFPWATAIGIGVVAAFAVVGYRHGRRRGEIDGEP